MNKIGFFRQMIFKAVQEPKNKKRSAYIWNIFSSTATAGSAPIIIMILVRFVSVDVAGYYSTSIAVANISYVIVSYYIFNYQITDIRQEYTFKQYLSSKVIAFPIMILFLIFYVIYSHQNIFVIKILFLQNIYRCIDAICEVYQAQYQQKGRMDFGCKIGFLRQVIPDIILICLVLAKTYILYALVVSVIIKILFVLIVHFAFNPLLETDSEKKETKPLRSLYISCFPLFFGALLMSYIQSAPRLSVATYLSPIMQTYCSIIFMPALIIHFFCGIIYRPMLTPLAMTWMENKRKEFFDYIYKILFLCVAFLGICFGAAWFLGIPVLNLIYSVDISSYKLALLVVIVGGAVNAASVFLSQVITIFRKQKVLIFIYLTTAITTVLIMGTFVQRIGLLGAAFGFLISMFIQFFFMFITICYYRKHI